MAEQLALEQVAGMAAQLRRRTAGRRRRLGDGWPGDSSLPVPLSPVMKIGAREAAMRSISGSTGAASLGTTDEAGKISRRRCWRLRHFNGRLAPIGECRFEAFDQPPLSNRLGDEIGGTSAYCGYGGRDRSALAQGNDLPAALGEAQHFAWPANRIDVGDDDVDIGDGAGLVGRNAGAGAEAAARMGAEMLGENTTLHRVGINDQHRYCSAWLGIVCAMTPGGACPPRAAPNRRHYRQTG